MENKNIFSLLNVEFIDEINLAELNIPSEILEKLDEKFLRDNKIVPLAANENNIIVLLSQPEKIKAASQLKFVFDKEIKIFGTTDENIIKILNYIVEKKLNESKNDIEIEEQDFSKLNQIEIQDILEKASEVPVIRWVNSTIQKAIYKNATDIHIEPFEQSVIIRFRIDGILFVEEILLKNLLQPIISRIKIMAKLDIAEQRLPQDGKIRIKSSDKEFDIRVSTLPTIYGERVVLRLLDKNQQFLSFTELGFLEKDIETIDKILSLKNGLIFVTGPTGSGKTTTLYSFLMKLNDKKRNILTIEDPVEYQLTGINQMNIKPEIDLTFARGLRHILRQDPDIIMIGEVRDYETAEISVRSSLTGHLVFSTLHTNDAISAITRLIDMGIPPYLVASSVRAIIAQRLIRKLCPFCKIKRGTEYSAAGCEKCNNTGYKGRFAVYEILFIDVETANLIHYDYNEYKIREYCKNSNFKSMYLDGLLKIERGITSKEELLSIIP